MELATIVGLGFTVTMFECSRTEATVLTEVNKGFGEVVENLGVVEEATAVVGEDETVEIESGAGVVVTVTLKVITETSFALAVVVSVEVLEITGDSRKSSTLILSSVERDSIELSVALLDESILYKMVVKL